MTRNLRDALSGFALFVIAILALGNGLLLAPSGSPPHLIGALILFLLPGLVWSERLLSGSERLVRLIVGAGLSYALAMALGLILHYLPGPIPLWAGLVTLNFLGLIAGGWRLKAEGRNRKLRAERRWALGAGGWGLVVLLIVAACFRLTSLGYSEFQGDEALAMISAAEALEGHQDALFLRGKGPGEVLLPMLLWRLTGTTNELTARLPFAIAGLLMVATTYSLGRKLLAKPAGLIAAGLLALNGFMVGFSRIVQYQTLVVWMSALALLCAWEWRASTNDVAPSNSGAIWGALAGIFLGAGLLAHYDAILVAPALIYVQFSNSKWQSSNITYHISHFKLQIPAWLAAALSFCLVAGLFYLPYALDPQAVRTGDYLGDRIGDTLIKNNFDSFLRFNAFYNSSYYLILTGLLVLGFLAGALRGVPGIKRVPAARYWLPVVAILVTLGLALQPHAFRLADLDLAVVPFALILLGAFVSRGLDAGQRTTVAWLAVPFLGYNFGVALPLSHVYTIVPAWTLLAAAQMTNTHRARCIKFQMANVKYQIPSLQYPKGTMYPEGTKSLISNNSLCFAGGCLLLALLFSGYLFSAYLRQDVEFWQDWPASQPALYWYPYNDPPPAGFFGFVHRTGWKEVGGLYANGSLSGDYGSNEEPDVTSWYTRGAPRACDPKPEYYLIADDLIDPWPVNPTIIQANYDAIGQITLPNSKSLTIYQTRPAAKLDQLETDALIRAFNRTATPAAFARSARGSQSIDANLENLIRLVGYDVDARHARPGGRVAVTLYWQAQDPISEDYHVFVHLEGESETAQIWGQADGRPVCWTYPTFDWRPGQIIADQHAFTVNPDTPPGDYPILVGMYLADSGQRLELLDQGGNPVANFVELTRVSIR